MELTPTLVGRSVILRPPRESDKRDRRACVRNPEEFRMYGLDFENQEALSRETSDAWYERYAGQPFHWAISYHDRCIGTARLSRIEEETGTARFSIGIFDSSLWDKGLGAEATSLVLNCAFESANLSRVELRVLDFNTRAIACYGKCGFSKDGIVENAVFMDGKWHCELIMGVSVKAYRAMTGPEAGRIGSRAGSG